MLFLFEIFVAVFLFFSTASAVTSSCSEVNLSQNLGIAEIPRWSQGSTKLCYAFSAATLIDNYRFTHGDKDFQHITSPLLLAFKTISTFQERGSSVKGGKIEHAFAAARQFGSCSAKIISDKLGSYTIDTLLNELGSLHKDSDSERIFKFLKNSGAKISDLPTISDIEKNILLSKDEFIARTLLGFCTERKNLDYLPALKLLFQPHVTSVQILERIQNLLTSQIPLGVNFCSNVVTDRNYKGSMHGTQWYCRGQLNHSALIVGRKMHRGQCQFKIQDSGCKGYTKNPGVCQKEQYWLTVDQLINNTHGIYWLD